MKKFLALLLAFAMVFTFAACGEGGEEPADDTGEEPGSGDGYELVMWMFSDATMNDQGELFDKWRSDFLSQHPEVKSIEFVAKGDSELLTGITAGVGLPDIVFSSFTYGRSYLDAVDLIDLSDLYADEEWAEGFYEDAVSVTNVDGGYWAIPFMSYVPLIWRNLDALEAAGIDPDEGEPTMDVFIEHLQQANDAGLIATHSWTAGGVYGPGAVMGADYEKFGNPLEIVDGKTTVSPTALTRTFEYILKINEQGNGWAYNDDAAVEAFKSGELAYLLGGPWDEPSWQQAGVNYDVVLVPPYEEGSNVYGGFFGWDGMYGIDSGDEGRNEAIKAWLDTDPDSLSTYVTDIQYSYDTPLNVFKSDTSDGAVQVNPATVMDALGFSMSGSTQTEMLTSMSGGSGSAYDVWTPLLANRETWERDYDVVAGRMPESWDEVVVYVDKNDRISDYTLYALGLLDQDELRGMMSDVLAGEKVEGHEKTSYTYDDLLNLTFKLVPESSKYAEGDDGVWEDMSEDSSYMRDVVDEAEEIRVVGIVRPSEDNESGSNWGAVMYTPELMAHLIEEVDASAAVKAQRDNPSTDIFTGVQFPDDVEVELDMESIEAIIAQMPDDQGAQMQEYVDQLRDEGMSDEAIASAFSRQLSAQTDNATYEGNLEKLGVADLDEPYSISIYPVDFEAKERVDQIIEDYNEQIRADGEGTEIQYTDIVGTMMSSVTGIVNSITYILIAFVGISLVVSSIMIGIITYISVLERTKEIGILRAIGASKRDVSRIFTAETFIIGFVSGVLGILVTVLLDIPVNIIIEQVSGVADLAAVPAGAGVTLVIISVVLSLVAGLAPSRMAAKKDPVTALRTE